MSSYIKYLSLFQLIVGVSFLSIINIASSTDCAKCETVRATFNTSNGSIGGLNVLPALEGQPTEVKNYRMEVGKRLPITYAPETSCGSTHATLGCCSNVFFFRRAQETLWQMGKTVTLQASDDTSCDLGDGTCGCADCTKAAGCTCSGCYSPAVPPDTQEIDVYHTYKAWTKQEAVFPVDSVPTGGDVAMAAEAWVTDQITNNNGWTFLGWKGAGNWTAIFKDTTNTTSITYDSDATPGPVERDTDGESPSIPGRFIAWTGTPEKKTVTIEGTGSPETFCDCATRKPPQKTGPVQDSLTAFLWSDPSSEKSDPGSSSISGPEEGGGSDPDDGNAPGVPLRIDFGLDRSSTGLNLALLSYSTQLDDSVPFAIEKFQLLQPFAEPGAEPVIVTDNPEPGITRRMVGLGTIVDLAIAADGSSASLTFKDAATGDTDALHLLERILATVDHDPGIRHTITRNGQTQVTTLYGQTTSSGGRSWKIINPAGDITAGVSAPYNPNDTVQVRSEGISHLKMVNNEEVLLDGRVDTYQKFAFGERLITSTSNGGGSQSQTTTYTYVNSGNPAVDGLLETAIYPDGGWLKNEYDAQTGKLKREYRPWLSSVTTPADATLQNSKVITHVDVGTDESWEIESIQGVVTTRNWTRHKWDQLDPTVMATNYEWATPLWRVSIPAGVHAGDYATQGKTLGVSAVGGQEPTIYVVTGTISDALHKLSGNDVSYLTDEQRWAARCKHPSSFNLYEKHIDQAGPATITVTCGVASDTTDTLNFSLISEVVVGLPEEIFSASFATAGAVTAQEVAQSLYDYLSANAAGYLDVSINIDNATVTISSHETNAQQQLNVSGTPNTFTPDKVSATGTDYAESWQLVATSEWKASKQNWQASMSGSLTNQIPAERQISVASSDAPDTRIAVADHSGRLDLALAALLNDTVTYSDTPLKFNTAAYVQPPAFLVSEKVWIPGTTYVPPVPATGASSSVTCGDPFFSDNVTVSVADLSQTYYTDIHFSGCTTAAEIASALAGVINMDFGNTLSASSSDGVVNVNTQGTGSSAWFSINGGGGGVFSSCFGIGSDGSPEIQATQGHDSWTVLTSCDWVPMPSAATPQTPSPLGDLNLFNGSFDTTMTQRFTADYNAWDGSLVLRDANSSEGVSGDIRRSVDSSGRITMYSYDRGTYNDTDQSFDWSQAGQAVKLTTRTYAADPSTFELLAQDPVFQVTMTDYQGQTRVDQTWKDTDLVVESTHDYDSATRDRISSKQNGVTIYSAVRDTTANTLTETDSAGTTTLTAYDDNGGMASTAKMGFGGRPDIVSTSADNGLTTTSTTTAGGLTRSSSTTRNALGQIVSSIDENGLETTYTYELYGRRTIETRPDDSTRITETYLDGRLKSVTGTGVVPEFHTYSVDSDGNLTETVYLNDSGLGTSRSPRWRSTTTNGLGWVVAETQPAGSAPGAGVLVTRHTYNVKGQRISTQRAGQKSLLYSYDVFGRQSAQGIDLNSDNQLTTADALTTSQTSYVQQSGNWFEQTVTTETAGTDRSATSRTRTSMRLLGGALYSSAIEYTSDGLVTTTATSTDPTIKTVTTVATSNRSNLSQMSTVVNGLLLSETGKGGTGTISYDYDALERPTVVQDITGIRRRSVYADLTDGTARSLIAHEDLMPAGGTAYATQRSYTYHPAHERGAGQVDTITQADGNTLSYTYDLLGHQVFVGGSATSPVRYVYDDFGDLWKMHTYRDGTPTATSTGDVTTWVHDPATGQLMGKTDAQSKGSSQSYDPTTGRLYQRTLARRTPNNNPITITYHYDDAGHVSFIDYSDDTPDVTFTYYADGQLKTTTDAAGLHTYVYAGPNGQLSGESVAGGLLDGSSWSTTFETTTNRRDVYTWSWVGVGSRGIDFDYDTAGRLGKVTAFGHSATYGYEASTGRKNSLTYSGAALTGGWHMDALGRLEYTTWTVGSTQLSRHTYGYNDMHRRTSAQRETGETWRYDYDQRGEVTSAVKRLTSALDASAKRGLQFGYGYDLIGNRIMDAQHTPDSGSNLDQVTWTANSLNQITGREQHASRWVFGHVKSPAQLSVTGGGTVIREGDEFTVPVTRAGAATNADWHSLEVSATLPGAGRVENGTAKDVTTQRHGKVWFPASPESLAYDDDGNLIQDGRWTYTWDAENRLASAATRTDVAAATGMPQIRLDFAYDAQNRRIRKAVSELQPGSGNTAPLWKLTSDLRFLYDSWNLLAEIEMVNPVGFSTQPKASLARAYAWGTDVSGSMTGAGGVGGLLLVQRAGNVAEAPCYDGNGNISAYVRVATGAVTSRHDYDAFGRPIWNELEGTGGRQAAASPFGFSTKYMDAETGWCYYGYRYYAPEIGRWPSRDPIGEDGGVNLYGMLGNNLMSRNDILGLWAMEIGKDIEQTFNDIFGVIPLREPDTTPQGSPTGQVMYPNSANPATLLPMANSKGIPSNISPGRPYPARKGAGGYVFRIMAAFTSGIPYWQDDGGSGAIPPPTNLVKKNTKYCDPVYLLLVVRSQRQGGMATRYIKQVLKIEVDAQTGELTAKEEPGNIWSRPSEGGDNGQAGALAGQLVGTFTHNLNMIGNGRYEATYNGSGGWAQDDDLTQPPLYIVDHTGQGYYLREAPPLQQTIDGVPGLPTDTHRNHDKSPIHVWLWLQSVK